MSRRLVVLFTAPALLMAGAVAVPRSTVEERLIVTATVPPDPVPVPTTSSTSTAPPPTTRPASPASPATTAPRRPAPPTRCGRWASLIAAHFPAGQVAKACRVMLCESRGDPTARNPRSSASGLWQFLDSTWRATTGRRDRAYQASPDVQTAAAAKLWRSRGWRPWECA